MKDRLRRFDLNLLVAFRTLMEERSVSKTADRLYVSQPAMSKSLQRLREQCGDELFTRSASGLIPTPEAHRLYPAVVLALAELEQVLFDPQFDPLSVEDEIRIAILESASSWFIPALVERFQAQAPGLALITSNTETDSLEQLAVGKLDFAIYPRQEFGSEYELTDLNSFKPVLWMSHSHPLAKKRQLKKQHIEQYPLVMLDAPDVENKKLIEAKAFLEKTGISLTPILETSMLNTAIEVLYNSEAVLIAPTHMRHSKMIRDHFTSREITGFQAFEDYDVELALIQHVRSKSSALHGWVKQQIVDVVARSTE